MNKSLKKTNKIISNNKWNQLCFEANNSKRMADQYKQESTRFREDANKWKELAQKAINQCEVVDNAVIMQLEKFTNSNDQLQRAINKISQEMTMTIFREELRLELGKVADTINILMEKIIWIESITKDRYELKFEELSAKVVELKKQGIPWREVYNKLKLHRYPALKDRLKKLYQEGTPQNEQCAPQNV